MGRGDRVRYWLPWSRGDCHNPFVEPNDDRTGTSDTAGEHLAFAARRCLRLALVGLAALRFGALRAATCAAADDGMSPRCGCGWNGAAAPSSSGKARVRLADGTLSDPVPLGIEADEPGSMWIGDDGALVIHPRSVRSYDGVDFTVDGAARASLAVKLTGPGDRGGLDVQVPLAQRRPRHVFASPLDAAGNRLLIRRVPGDRLRVKLAHDSVIFSPGEVAKIEVQPHLAAGGSADARAVGGPAIRRPARRAIRCGRTSANWI